MPAPRPSGEVKSRWQKFVRFLRPIETGLAEHRHQDQFLRIKDAALSLAEGEAMADEIERGYREVALPDNQPSATADVAEVVVAELEAFPLAVEVHQAEEKAGTAKPGAVKRLRAAAKTILGSVGDVFKLSDYGKGVLCVVKEALDLGNDA